MTTAETLVQYRKELVDGGFLHDTADQMAIEAARLIIGANGLSVTSIA